MSQTTKQIAGLIEKYLKQEITETETQELNAWLGESLDHKEIFEKLTDADYLEQAVVEFHKYNPSVETWQRLMYKIENSGGRSKIRSIWPRLSVAAAILILFATAALFILNTSHKKDQVQRSSTTTTQKPDIGPGASKATLTLADGRTIVLDSVSTGQLAQQGTTQVMNKDGKLVYAAQGKNENEVLYNTLATARGQMYPIVLSDNSRIWLNSESSIKYPVAFVGNERRVEITGEAYFEIAHDASKPFIVVVDGTEIKVLGTKFNVNAYEDEDRMKTTLLEGSVQVKKGIQHAIIMPGQQAQVSNDETGKEKGIHVISDVNTSEVIAWKNGLFNFDGEDIPTALRQLARWYNIDIVYAGEVPKDKFMGEVERNLNLSQALKILERAGLQFTLEGRKLIVKQQ